MNRASYLTQQYQHLLKQKRIGAPATKKSYAYVMHKVLTSLQKLRYLPTNWKGLNNDIVHCLVQYWQQHGDKPTTIKNRLSVLRQLIGVQCFSENKAFALNSVKKKSRQTFKTFDINKIESPIVKTIVDLEMAFGLTKLESMQWSFSDGLEKNNVTLIVHRTQSHNKKRREVPVLTEAQRDALVKRKNVLAEHDTLLGLYSITQLVKFYSANLSLLNINVIFRDYYINQRFQQLRQLQDETTAVKILMQELGLADKRSLKNHLWST